MECKPSRAFRELHSKGYYVFRGIAEPIPSSIISVDTGFRQIFNPDQKRSQRGFRKNSNFLKNVEEIVRRRLNLGPNRKFRNWVMLRSVPGCKNQQAHCDYEPDPVFEGNDYDDVPLGMLVGLMPGTKLHVWPKAIKLFDTLDTRNNDRDRYTRKTLQIDKGDVLVFRGDLVHAGSGYLTLNYRMHCFIDVDKVSRPSNRTWIIKEHAPKEIRNNFELN